MSLRAAVLGQPVAHSLSPVLHRAAYQALGFVDWDYQAIDCDAAGLPQRLARSGADLLGYSCTMPLKHAALELAQTAAPIAVEIGAANTLLRTDSGWHADNTDWVGVRDALDRAGTDPGNSVAILGAGGTAQAVLAATRSASRITVAVRDASRTAALRATAARLALDVNLVLLSDTAAIAGAGLVISTLPPGAADPLTAAAWRAEHTVLDVVYARWPTPLATSAAERGARVISGAQMLLFQAAAQVELMTGRTAPVEAMRAALREAVPGCGV